MTPYYADEHVTLYHGDCLTVTEWLTADVLVTDPPYGRDWRQGDTGRGRGWASDSHPGIANDEGTEARDAALSAWGERPAIVFGDLLLPAPKARETPRHPSPRDARPGALPVPSLRHLARQEVREKHPLLHRLPVCRADPTEAVVTDYLAYATTATGVPSLIRDHETTFPNRPEETE